MEAIDARPRIAKATLMHDGLLVEFRSGLVIFYRDAFLWEQQDYALARRAAAEKAAEASAAPPTREEKPE